MKHQDRRAAHATLPAWPSRAIRPTIRRRFWAPGGRVYAAVLVYLAGLIAASYLFTRAYR